MACMALIGCADEGPDPVDDRPPPLFQGLVLSNPLGRTRSAPASRMALAEGVVFVSLPPGTVADGVSATITNPLRGAQVTTAMVQGGFDPVPIAAEAGDSLSVRIDRGENRGSQLLYAKVPPRQAPVIVRTDPPRGRRNVPLNSRLAVVFSEPLDPVSLRPTSIRLTRGPDAVPIQVAFTDSSHVAISVTPDASLEPSASYLLEVSDALADTDGETLDERATVPFVTALPGTGGCCTPFDAVFERAEPALWTDYHTEFILRADGTFTLHYLDPSGQWPDYSTDGWYTRVDTTVTFELFANAGHPMGPQGGIAVLRDGVMAVRFNEHALADDFEPGDFLLRVAGGDTTARGVLRVTVRTSGTDAPASVRGVVSGDGLRSIRYDLPASDHPTLPVGSTDLPLAPGRYTLAVALPANCTAGPPLELDVTAGRTTSASLDIACTAWSTAWVSYVITTPTGPNPTIMRLVYVCDGEQSTCTDYWADPGGAIVARVAGGAHVATFSAYPNCFANLPQSRFTVASGQTVSMAITASCDQPPSNERGTLVWTPRRLRR